MQPVKALILGAPGTGKTSMLAQLANAGYHIHMADFDGCSLPLRTYTAPEAQDRLHITTLQDKMTMDPSTMMPGFASVPRAYPAFVKMMQKDWDGRALKEYGLRHIFVFDSLSAMSQMVFNYSSWQNGNSGKRPHPTDYHNTNLRMEAHMSQVNLAPVNFLVLGHFVRVTPTMDLQGDKDEQSQLPKHGDLYQRYPYVVGRGLPPRIGAYFPVILHAQRKGEGAAARRFISTGASLDAETKCPLPADAKFPNDVPVDKLPALFAALGSYKVEDIAGLPDTVEPQA